MPTILDSEQLAEVLQMNAETLRRMTREGFLPCHRIGGSVRYCLEDILARTKVGTHPDDQAVDAFAEAMHGKMAHARGNGAEGWDNPDLCPVERLAALLVQAVAKGDPVDVGNFAMMLHARGAEPEVLASSMTAALERAAGVCE
jgi:hypothetical protein